MHGYGMKRISKVTGACEVSERMVSIYVQFYKMDNEIQMIVEINYTIRIAY